MASGERDSHNMKLYHGSDNPEVNLKSVKDGKGYHPGAGPVEFLGPSFSQSRKVAASYGKHIIQIEFSPKKVKRYRSLNSLRSAIIQTFGMPVSGQNTGDYYRDIADSYKVKLLAEGYEAVSFPEGVKTATDKYIANTVI